MKKLFFSLLITFIASLFAGGSVIVEAEGIASLGDDKSKKETMQEALENAKRTASENAQTYIKSETVIKDFQTQKDLVESYSRAKISNITKLEEGWFTDALSGQSYKVKIRCEVLPDKKIEEKVNAKMIDDPSAPLTVSVTTNQPDFKAGQLVKIYLKANKPFFARVVYKQADSSLVQLLPNPYRTDNYFNGGTTYELPSGKDQYKLEVSAPFGTENITVYASTEPLGDVNLTAAGNLYQINDNLADTGIKTRGIKIAKKDGNGKNGPAEFFEGKAVIVTGK